MNLKCVEFVKIIQKRFFLWIELLKDGNNKRSFLLKNVSSNFWYTLLFATKACRLYLGLTTFFGWSLPKHFVSAFLTSALHLHELTVEKNICIREILRLTQLFRFFSLKVFYLYILSLRKIKFKVWRKYS